MARIQIKCEDPVQVTCYGQTRTYERADAIKFYGDCARFCEGAERDRYINIYFQLIDGEKEVHD